MRRRDFLQRLLVSSFVVAPSALSGCGTILHKERVNQPHSRDIDWSVVALDGLGLLLFFVPGVIAFAVDFYTGAIYLPPTQTALLPQPDGSSTSVSQDSSRVTEQGQVANASSSFSGLREFKVDRHALSPERIESIVSEQASATIDLASGDVRASELEHLDNFAQQRRRHEQDSTFGSRARDLLAQVLPG